MKVRDTVVETRSPAATPGYRNKTFIIICIVMSFYIYFFVMRFYTHYSVEIPNGLSSAE